MDEKVIKNYCPSNLELNNESNKCEGEGTPDEVCKQCWGNALSENNETNKEINTRSKMIKEAIKEVFDSKRRDKINYYLDIAETVSIRSTCIRRKYGAVIVKDDEIVSTGYNGSPRGEINCCDIGYCQREKDNIPHGSNYELCKSVHAEQNAIISASRKEMIGSTLYLVGIENSIDLHKYVKDTKPCDICRRLIKNAGIKQVIVRINKEEYRILEV